MKAKWSKKTRSSASIPVSQSGTELSRWGRLKASLLTFAGVALAENGKSVLDYHPEYYQAGFNFMLVWPLLPGFLNRAHLIQLLILLALMHLWCWFVADTATEAGQMANQMVVDCYSKVASLSRFVLGLFVSLVLSRTYYVNRDFFDIVTGVSMSVTQMIAAWVCRPEGGTDDAVRNAQRLLVRWINAALHLMVLENLLGKGDPEIAEKMMQTGLLTEHEWHRIKNKTNRVAHLYQWSNCLIYDLFRKGYISQAGCVVRMHKRIDLMRGCNAWGYPSVPFTYTQIITHMVKAQMLMLAIGNGVMLAKESDMGGSFGNRFLVKLILHLDVVLEHYLFQGLLDLHGALYNPNNGSLLGHLAAMDFIAWVRKVCEELLEDSMNMYYPATLDLPTAKQVQQINEKTAHQAKEYSQL